MTAYVNTPDELRAYLQKVGDHYFRADWTIGAYQQDDGIWVYWRDYKGYCECSSEPETEEEHKRHKAEGLCPECHFGSVEELIESENIDFPMEIGE